MEPSRLKSKKCEICATTKLQLFISCLRFHFFSIQMLATPSSCCCVVIATTPFLLWPLFLSQFVPTLLRAFANTAPILLLVKYPPRHQSCLAIRLSFPCPLLLGSLVPPLVSTSHPVSLDFISSSSATKLPFDVWSCLVEIFGHVFPPRQFFLSRVSVVLESVDYLHLFSYPQRLIPNLYLPSFLSKTNICGPCFFHPGNIYDTSGLRICSCSRCFQVQCLVHRLHHLLEGQVYLQGLNRSSPFQASEPVRPCTSSISNSVRPGRTFLASVFVHKGK